MMEEENDGRRKRRSLLLSSAVVPLALVAAIHFAVNSAHGVSVAVVNAVFTRFLFLDFSRLFQGRIFYSFFMATAVAAAVAVAAAAAAVGAISSPLAVVAVATADKIEI